jgi:acetyl-CoA carboxylase biotin carboxyl carrier protein
MDIDLDELAALVELLKEAEFSEFRYEKADLRIVVRRSGGSMAEDAWPDKAIATVEPVRDPHTAPAASRVAAPASAAVAAVSKSKANPLDVQKGTELVTAPLLGTFYSRPKPGETPFVSVGDPVEADTVLCIVEVMKLMNTVVAGMRGVIAGIHANDGDLIEFGQLLFSITPISE